MSSSLTVQVSPIHNNSSHRRNGFSSHYTFVIYSCITTPSESHSTINLINLLWFVWQLMRRWKKIEDSTRNDGALAGIQGLSFETWRCRRVDLFPAITTLSEPNTIVTLKRKFLRMFWLIYWWNKICVSPSIDGEWVLFHKHLNKLDSFITICNFQLLKSTLLERPTAYSLSTFDAG